MHHPIRWVSQFEHFKTTLAMLEQCIDLTNQQTISAIEKLGLILCFKQNYELAWLCLKQCFENQGEIFLDDKKAVIRLAFRRGLIQDGETWMDMLKNISKINETYKKDFASLFSEKIITVYYPVFLELKNILEKQKQKEEQ
jgi:nucleotidyltransferase substrate binding protein (TIGR01987 family)